MKKYIALFLVATILLSLCACSSSRSKIENIEDITDEEWEAAAEALTGMYENDSPAETEAVEKIYQLGEVIPNPNGSSEFSIDSFCFSDYWDYSENDVSYMAVETPDVAWGTADEGKTFLLVSGTMTLTEEINETTEYMFSTTRLTYKDDYEFKDETWRVRFPDGTFNGTSNTAVFEPLMDANTRILSFYIEIPDVIATDTESSLLLATTAWFNDVKTEIKIQLR